MMVSWLLCLVVAVVLVAVLVALIARRAKAGVTQPACGKCGYAVQGLPTFTCPECGSDLRAVGIVMPKADHGLRRVAWAVVWTILLPIPMLLTARLGLTAGLPMVATRTDTVTLAAASSGAYHSITVTATGSGTGWAAQRRSGFPMQTVSLTLTAPGGGTPALVVDGMSLASRWTPPQDQLRQGPLTPVVLGEWMASVGVDPDDVQVQAEIAYLDKLVRGAGNGLLPQAGVTGPFGVVSPSSHINYVPAPGAKAVTLLFSVFWFALWVAGLWWCLRRKKAKGPETPLAGGEAAQA
jgi:hypothetical protein